MNKHKIKSNQYSRLSKRGVLLFFVALCPFSFALALLSGSVDTPFSALLSSDAMQWQIISQLRLPRAASAFVTGGLLSLAGALMQVLLRNPLADPYILGISGGAATASLLAMLIGVSGIWINSAALFGALFSMILVFGLAHGKGAWTATRLLLTGVVVAAGWGAVISFILTIAPQHDIHGMLFWLMGDLSYANSYHVALVVLLVSFLISMILARDLNIFSLNELQAKSLGVDAERLRISIYFLASLLTAVAVSVAGSIGFVGLIVPHILRLLGLSDHRLLLPAAVCFGGSLLVVADTLARTIIAPQQLPVGIITAMLGVPMFLLLMHRSASRS